MSTPTNDETTPPDTAEIPPSEVAEGQSKDISDMIQITNEFAFVGEAPVGGEDEDDERGEDPVDCFLGPDICDPVKGALDEHVVPKMDEATKSIRGALEEHVVPKVDEVTTSIRGALDEHVVPKVGEVTTSIQGALDEHVVPKLDMAKGALDEHVVPAFDMAKNQSIRAIDTFKEGSIRSIETVKEGSIRTMESFKGGSQKFISDVQENSKKGVEEVQKCSVAFLDGSKAAIDGVAATTVAIVDEKVKPGYNSFVENSQNAIRSTSEGVQNYAPCYMGTAPGWTSITTDTTSTDATPWYWVLEEATLRAFGRVVFCDNPVTGAFIWLGILCASPLGAFCALLSVLTANATALYFDMDQEILQSGLYARNAALIGASIVDSFAFEFPETGNLNSGVPIMIFLSIALAPVVLLVESIWIQKFPSGIPSLLFPYNIVLLMTLFCAKIWNLAMETQIEFNSPVDGILEDEMEGPPSKFWIHEAVLNGLSRIFLVDGNLFAGILILAGVLFCSRIVAASLLAGSFLSTFVLGYIVFEENHWYLDSGYAGFNPALCVAGIFFYLVPSWKLTGLALFGIVVTVIVQGAVDVMLDILGAPVSTSLGFCITLLPLLTMDLGSTFGSPEDYFIRTVPESELSTPEQYLKSLDSTPPDHPTDSSSSDEDDEVDPEAPPEVPPTNEESPLLS